MDQPSSFPAAQAESWAMITLPDEIDMLSARRVGDALVAMIADGVKVAVVDMSATTFCDSSGVEALMRAYHRAQDMNTDLRLVVPADAVRRVFELLDLGGVLPVYPTLAEATAGAPAGLTGPLAAGERKLADLPAGDRARAG